MVDLVRGYEERGDLRLAAQLARTAASADPGLLSMAGMAWARAGDEASALATAQLLRAQDADLADLICGAALVRGSAPERGVTILGALRNRLPQQEKAAYHLALGLWRLRRLDEAEALVVDTLSGSKDAGCLEQMLGWIEVSREHYAAAGRHFLNALAAHDASGQSDAVMRAKLLQALSIIALETIDLRLVANLDFGLPDDLGAEAREPAFYAMQNLGWLRMLDGDEHAALALFTGSRALASAGTLSVAADLNLTSFFRIVGDRDAARRHFALARDAITKQHWSEANADTRMTLLEYALEAYQLEPTTVGPTLTRYMSSTTYSKQVLVFEHDRRVRAAELTTRGVIDALFSRRAQAKRNLRDALALWSALGYRYREASTALLLLDLDGGEQALDSARRAVASASRSWLHREISMRREQARSHPGNLTPAERRVMLAICEGKTSRQIAAEFGRSYHTIRNQTLRAYEVMGVRSRSALVAACARLGMVTEPKG